MSYNLFLDDERKPQNVVWVQLPLVYWTIVKNYKEFVDTITKNGLPAVVTFDHDLADEHYQEYFEASNPFNIKHEFRYEKMKEKTGYDCVKWLVDYCREKGLPFPEYYVHTMNPIGKENIIKYIESYKKSQSTVGGTLKAFGEIIKGTPLPFS